MMMRGHYENEYKNTKKVALQILALKKCADDRLGALDSISLEIVLAVMVSAFCGQELTVKELVADSRWSSGAIQNHLKALASNDYILIEKRAADRRFSHLVPSPKLLRKFDSFTICANEFLNGV